MSLTLIIGRSNSGKSKKIYEIIKENEKANISSIVFVPDFARMVAEEEYFKYTKNSAMFNTKIATLSRFIDQNTNFKKMFAGKNFLPDSAKELVIRKCIEDNGKEFNIFRKVKDTPGFLDKLSKIISSMDNENISQNNLEKIFSENTFLSLKFKEIYAIYKKIKEYTTERFVTSQDGLQYFVEDIYSKKIQKLENTEVFFDEYNNFNDKELSVIYAMLSMGINVTITLDLDLEAVNLTDIFIIPNETYIKLKKMCNEIGCKLNEVVLKEEKNISSNLAALKNGIFTLGAKHYVTCSEDESVNIQVLSNPCEEIEYIAKDILYNVKNNSMSFKDFKIYYNDENMYFLNIQKIVGKYNIPVYMNSKGSVLNNTLVLFMQSLVELVKNGFNLYSVKNILQMLKTGLLDSSEEEIAVFENYILEFGINGYLIQKPFRKNSKENGQAKYDLAKLNNIRQNVLDDICDLITALKKQKTTIKQTEIIYTFLEEKNIISRYAKQIQTSFEFDVDEYNKKKQVVGYIYGIMDNICLAFEALDYIEYLTLFEYGMSALDVKSVPPYIDQVEICNIDSTRSMPRKNVYIIGVYEGGIPILSNSEGMFTDKEIEELKKYDIEISKSTDSRNSMALYNVYKGINSCTEKLVLTIPSSKITGEGLRQSPIISRIKDIINVTVSGNIAKESTSYNTEETLSNVFSMDEIYNEFVSDVQKLVADYIRLKEKSGNDEEACVKFKKNIQEVLDKYSVLEADEKYADTLKYVRVVKKLSPETISKIYGDNIETSISKLENFSACAFKYYSDYILRLKEKKEYKISSRDLGTIMHKVLEDVTQFVCENNIGFENIATIEANGQKIKEVISTSLDNTFGVAYEKYNANPKFEYLKSKLNKSMYNVIIAISNSFMQSEFRTIGSEIEFKKGAKFEPIEIQLENGKTMYLTGKIDRIDSAKINDKIYLRVVDYKSSGKDIKLSDVKEGKKLQLMTYMSSLIDNFKNENGKENANENVLPAAISYFTLKTSLLQLDKYQTEDKISEELIKALKMSGIYISDVEVLSKLDNNFTDAKKSYISVSTKNLKNTQKVLSEEMFLEECSNIKKTLNEIGKKVLSGDVTASKKKEPCEYCKYSGLCRKKVCN